MREFLEKNKVVSVVIIIGLLAVAALAIVLTMRPTAPKISQAYYYDLATKELFTEAASLVPPIKSRDGKSADGAVRAYVFSCNACADKSSHFIGYLEKYSEEAKKSREGSMNQFAKRPAGEGMQRVVKTEMTDKTSEERYVASPDSPDKWVLFASEQGIQIPHATKTKCNGNDAIPCLP